MSNRARYRAFFRFAQNKAAVVSGLVVAGLVLLALVGPFFTPFGPLEQDLANNFSGPTFDHPLGTDDLGRDTLSRLIFAARVSLGISFTSVAVGLSLGTLFGLLAAYYGGWLDSVIMRAMDILLALPGMLLAVTIVAMLEKGIPNTILAVAIFALPTFARIVRGSALGILQLDFIGASRVMGASDLRIVLRHILPNVVSPLIVQATLEMGTAILIASGLSFLGLGVQPPHPEWGAMLSKGRELMRTTPVVAIAPGVAITLAVLSFSLLGDGLRDALDPRLERR
jgi:peptide/nickel transport system permease protein